MRFGRWKGKVMQAFRHPYAFIPCSIACCLFFTVAVVFFHFENHAPSASVIPASWHTLFLSIFNSMSWRNIGPEINLKFSAIHSHSRLKSRKETLLFKMNCAWICTLLEEDK